MSKIHLRIKYDIESGDFDIDTDIKRKEVSGVMDVMKRFRGKAW